VPILYAEDTIEAKGNEYIAYVFGVSPGAPLGGPWQIVAGARWPGPGEVIIDHAVANAARIGVGDRITVLGQEMRIAGLTSGTSSLVSSVTFITIEDFTRLRGGDRAISYVLVKANRDETPGALASRIADRVPGTTVQTRDEFATQERGLVQDMTRDLVGIMNTAGYLTGLAVVALTVYIATIARRREYGVLKAIGVRNGRLFEIVVIQALLSIALGLAAGLVLTVLLAAVIPHFDELIVLTVSPSSVLRVTATSVVLASVAAVLPALQIARLEPVSAIRRG
jgi:putative ABC transport system permease protein